MADEAISAIDEETRTLLDAQVKKGKVRKFILICKGAQIQSLVVFKKGPYGPRIMRMKKAGFKGQAYCGVITGKGVNLELQLPGTADVSNLMKAENQVYDSEPCKTAKFRKFLQDEASLKPEFSIVTRPEDVCVASEDDDGVDEKSESPQGESTSDSVAATESPPTDDTLQKKLTAALKKLTPLAKQAVTTAPDRRDEVLGRVGAIKEHLETTRLDEAKTEILELGAFLKQITSAAPPAADGVDGKATENENAEWTRQFARLEPDYLAALSQQPANASELRTIMTYATEQAEAGQYKKALAALRRLEPLVQAALSGEIGKETDVIEGGIVKKMQGALSRWDAGLDAVAEEMKVVQDGIRELDPGLAAMLGGIVEGYRQELGELLAAGQTALADAKADRHCAESQKVASRLRNEIKSEQLFALIDQFPGATVSLQETMLATLDRVEEELKV